MEKDTKDNAETANVMGMVLIFGLQEKDMMVNGKLTKNMEKEFI